MENNFWNKVNDAYGKGINRPEFGEAVKEIIKDKQAEIQPKVTTDKNVEIYDMEK